MVMVNHQEIDAALVGVEVFMVVILVILEIVMIIQNK
jgi:hypothetical protein